MPGRVNGWYDYILFNLAAGQNAVASDWLWEGLEVMQPATRCAVAGPKHSPEPSCPAATNKPATQWKNSVAGVGN
jgi:hypothetical protein